MTATSDATSKQSKAQWNRALKKAGTCWITFYSSCIHSLIEKNIISDHTIVRLVTIQWDKPLEIVLRPVKDCKVGDVPVPLNRKQSYYCLVILRTRQSRLLPDSFDICRINFCLVSRHTC